MWYLNERTINQESLKDIEEKEDEEEDEIENYINTNDKNVENEKEINFTIKSKNNVILNKNILDKIDKKIKDGYISNSNKIKKREDLDPENMN